MDCISITLLSKAQLTNCPSFTYSQSSSHTVPLAVELLCKTLACPSGATQGSVSYPRTLWYLDRRRDIKIPLPRPLKNQLQLVINPSLYYVLQWWNIHAQHNQRMMLRIALLKHHYTINSNTPVQLLQTNEAMDKMIGSLRLTLSSKEHNSYSC